MTAATLNAPWVAAIGGATVAAGVLCVAAGLSGHPAGRAGRPKRRSRPATVWAALVRPRRLRLLALAVSCGIAVLAVTRWPVAALAAAAAAVFLPGLVTGRSADDQIRRLEALEGWTRRLADLLAAGRGLEQAIEHSATRNLAGPIARPVATLARRLTVTRTPTEQALRLFAEELADPVADRIAAALILVARRRGRGAAAVLGGLAELVARDVHDRREVEAARAEHRTTVRWIIAILLTLTAAAVWQRTYATPFGTPVGQLVLAAVAACYAGSFWWLHRLAAGSPGHRLLDPVVSGQRAATGRAAR